MKFTVEYNDKMHRWDVVQWTDGVGTTVERCATIEDAEELCNYYTDMLTPELYFPNAA